MLLFGPVHIVSVRSTVVFERGLLLQIRKRVKLSSSVKDATIQAITPDLLKIIKKIYTTTKALFVTSKYCDVMSLCSGAVGNPRPSVLGDVAASVEDAACALV